MHLEVIAGARDITGSGVEKFPLTEALIRRATELRFVPWKLFPCGISKTWHLSINMMKQLYARNSSNGELNAILITLLDYKEIYIDCKINLEIENTSMREIEIGVSRDILFSHYKYNIYFNMKMT